LNFQFGSYDASLWVKDPTNGTYQELPLEIEIGGTPFGKANPKFVTMTGDISITYPFTMLPIIRPYIGGGLSIHANSFVLNQGFVSALVDDPEIAGLIRESQNWMAKKTAALHAALGTELWLVGYSELKEKGIFGAYRDTLKSTCPDEAWQRVYVFQHFSMNRFTIDLSEYIEAGKKENAPLESNIHELGVLHRKEIFGC
jgi:hypothetical protein